MRPREKAKRKQGKGEVRSLSRRGQRLMRKVTCWVSQTLWLKGCCEEEGRWRRKRNKMDEAWFTVLGTLGQYRACVPECSEWSSEELSTVGCALQCNAGPSLIPGRNRHPGPSGLVLVQQSSVQGYLRPGRHGETMQTRPRRQGLESRPVAMLASFNVNKCPPGGRCHGDGHSCACRCGQKNGSTFLVLSPSPARDPFLFVFFFLFLIVAVYRIRYR